MQTSFALGWSIGKIRCVGCQTYH